MINTIVLTILSFIVGVLFGMFLMSLAVISSREDEREEKETKNE